MKSLLASEWERLWSRKITWCFLFFIPLVVLTTAFYYQDVNEKLDISQVEYAHLYKFPVLALSEQLITFFNIVLICFLAFSITDEYRTGQIRMVLLRAYRFRNILLAKWLTILGTVFLFILFYLLCCYGIGALFFPIVSKSTWFYMDRLITPPEMFLYTIQYYGIAYGTLIVISAVFLAISVLSHSTTTAIGLSIAFLLASMAYPTILYTFTRGMNPPISEGWYFFSLTEIQFRGIARMLGEKVRLIGLQVTILLSYFLTFTSIAIAYFIRKDRFI